MCTNLSLLQDSYDTFGDGEYPQFIELYRHIKKSIVRRVTPKFYVDNCIGSRWDEVQEGQEGNDVVGEYCKNCIKCKKRVSIM